MQITNLFNFDSYSTRLTMVLLAILVCSMVGQRAVEMGVADFLLKPASFRVKEALSANPTTVNNSIAALPNGRAWAAVVADLEQASKLDPQQAAHQQQLGLAYMARAGALKAAPATRTTYYGIAKQYLEQAYELNPFNAFVLQNLILARAALGQHTTETAQLLVRFNILAPRERRLQNALLSSYAPLVSNLNTDMQTAYFAVLEQALRVNRQGVTSALRAQAKKAKACPEVWHPKLCGVISG